MPLPPPLPRAAPACAGGDPEAGKALFRSIRTLCHSNAPGQNKVGPSLFGVVGRRSGSVPGYSYSDANKNSGIVWTVDVLDKYLTSPQAVVPGTKMGYPGQKDDQKRADIVANLATLKQAPAGRSGRCFWLRPPCRLGWGRDVSAVA